MEGTRVLLVDDEVDFTDNTKNLLEHRGYDVTAVNSGDNAIRALGQEKYDVMVLDMKMPGRDGISTLKEIKKLHFNPQILVLTGHGAIDTALKAMELGAYDYLTKPCDIEELTEKLEDGMKKGESDNKRPSLFGALTKGIRKK